MEKNKLFQIVSDSNLNDFEKINALEEELKNNMICLNDKSEEGLTILHQAIRFGGVELIDWVLTHNMTLIYSVDQRGMNVLFFAVIEGCEDAAVHLLENARWLIDEICDDGSTILYYAVMSGNVELFNMLTVIHKDICFNVKRDDALYEILNKIIDKKDHRMLYCLISELRKIKETHIFRKVIDEIAIPIKAEHAEQQKNRDSRLSNQASLLEKFIFLAFNLKDYATLNWVIEKFPDHFFSLQDDITFDALSAVTKENYKDTYSLVEYIDCIFSNSSQIKIKDISKKIKSVVAINPNYLGSLVDLLVEFSQLKKITSFDEKAWDTFFKKLVSIDKGEIIILLTAQKINFDRYIELLSDLNCDELWGKLIFSGNIRLVKIIMNKENDINRILLNNHAILNSFLYVILAADDPKLLQSLMGNGFEYNTPIGQPPAPLLFYAIFYRRIKIIEYILSIKGIDIDMRWVCNAVVCTPLHLAVQCNFFEIIKLLINKGADYHSSNSLQQSPLDLAILSNNLNVAKYLLKLEDILRVDLGKKDEFKKYLIEFVKAALLSSDFELIGLLADKCFDYLAHFGIDLFCYAIFLKKHNIAEYLIKAKKVDFDKKISLDGIESTPLHLICRYGFIEIAKMQINAHKDFYKHEGQSFLCEAVGSGVEMVKWVMSNFKCNVHGLYNESYAPIHYAAANGKLDVLGYLIDGCGVSVNQQSHRKETALHLAVLEKQLNAVKSLIRYGSISFDMFDADGRKPIDYAIKGKGKNFEMMLYLYQPSDELRALDYFGRTLTASMPMKEFMRLKAELKLFVDYALALAKDMSACAKIIQNNIGDVITCCYPEIDSCKPFLKDREKIAMAIRAFMEKKSYSSFDFLTLLLDDNKLKPFAIAHKEKFLPVPDEILDYILSFVVGHNVRQQELSPLHIIAMQKSSCDNINNNASYNTGTKKIKIDVPAKTMFIANFNGENKTDNNDTHPENGGSDESRSYS